MTIRDIVHLPSVAQRPNEDLTDLAKQRPSRLKPVLHKPKMFNIEQLHRRLVPAAGDTLRDNEGNATTSDFRQKIDSQQQSKHDDLDPEFGSETHPKPVLNDTPLSIHMLTNSAKQ